MTAAEQEQEGNRSRGTQPHKELAKSLEAMMIQEQSLHTESNCQLQGGCGFAYLCCPFYSLVNWTNAVYIDKVARFILTILYVANFD